MGDERFLGGGLLGGGFFGDDFGGGLLGGGFFGDDFGGGVFGCDLGEGAGEGTGEGMGDGLGEGTGDDLGEGAGEDSIGGHWTVQPKQCPPWSQTRPDESAQTMVSTLQGRSLLGVVQDILGKGNGKYR